MSNIYMYPNVLLDNHRMANPYLQDLISALSVRNQIVNKERPSSYGIFDIIRYLTTLDMVYMNWIEDLPDKRGGIIQSIIFPFLLVYLKISGKKVIWTLHNRTSHSTKSLRIKKAIWDLMRTRSDLVITHASDGLQYIPEKTHKAFIPHPVKPFHQTKSGDSKMYDIIFWGAVTEYKGIDTFLSFLIEKNAINKYQILVAGRIAGKKLTERLMKINRDYQSVTVLNRYIPEAELEDLIWKSKLILFSYHSESVLSSGALTESLRFKSTIVGPDVGSFHDLSKENLIYSFKNYNHLIEVLDDLLLNYSDRAIPSKKIEKYIQDNSWEIFTERIDKIFTQL